MAVRLGAVGILVLAVALVGLAYAADDDSSNYTFTAGIKAKDPDSGLCLTTGRRCFKQILYCPAQCLKRSKDSTTEKSCFIDCDKCECTCKHRKPNCKNWGSLCYDPRLVGGDGTMFYFHGEKDQDFCLVSDRSLHINGHFIGIKPEGRTRDYTWVQALGVMFGSHQFSVGAKKVSHWEDSVDQLMFSFNGVSFSLEEQVGAKWTSANGQMTVERTYERNVVEVVIDEMLSMLVQVVPITAQEDKAHNYQLPADDVFAHLDLQFKFFNLSSTVSGVLGETYQPGYVSPAKVGVLMPVLGGEDRFQATGLLKADCLASQFSPEPLSKDVETLEPFRTDCSSKDSGNGIVCRR